MNFKTGKLALNLGQWPGVKLHHALALALVVLTTLSCHRKSAKWLLLLPRWTQTGVETSAPLSKWRVQDIFDTASACEQAKLMDKEKLILENMDADPPSIEVVGTCVATDDPRLKSN